MKPRTNYKRFIGGYIPDSKTEKRKNRRKEGENRTGTNQKTIGGVNRIVKRVNLTHVASTDYHNYIIRAVDFVKRTSFSRRPSVKKEQRSPRRNFRREAIQAQRKQLFRK